MKLACIGPLSPLRTGVADFSESLLPYLAERCDIELFTDGYSPTATPILSRFPAADISTFLSKPGAFDAALYQMGNHFRYHKAVFEALRQVPSIVLLHDCVLNHFFCKYALEQGNFGTFRRLLEFCYPNESLAEAPGFFKAKGDPYRFPMAGVVAACSRGTIVMNDYGRSIILKETPHANTLKIRFPHFPARAVSKSAGVLREKCRIPKGFFVVTSIGHITPAKRIGVALEAFRKFNSKFPESVFLLAGEVSPRFSLASAVREDLSQKVRYLGYLTWSELNELMEMTDVCVNLRYPSNGEMSSTLIEMVGRGKVVAVSDYAQFAEFPDATCVKIGIGPSESDDLADNLLRLATNSNRRRAIEEAARDYISRNHSPDAAADAIVNFAREHSKTKPLISSDELRRLLAPDDALRRSRQMVAYNARRFLSYAREQGVAQIFRQTMRRASARTA